MITVAILINGNPIIARSAHRTKSEKDGQDVYKVDTGEEVLHSRGDGAVALAIKLLKTVKE